MEISFIFLLAATLSCSVQTVKSCRPEEFSCGDHRKTCLPLIWWCDGDRDCLNGADEEGCVKSCTPEEFSCGDKHKTCLPVIWRCDGDRDCLNGADEEDCVTQGEAAAVTNQNQTAQSKVKSCTPEEFSCGDKHKTCLPVIWRCDGDRDCLNGADEEGCAAVTKQNQTAQSEVKSCTHKEFSCGDKHKTCLPVIWRCDGDRDCLNGADEEGCVTQGETAAVTNQNQTAQSEDEKGSNQRRGQYFRD